MLQHPVFRRSPPPLRTNRTRRVLHPVLIGHAASRFQTTTAAATGGATSPRARPSRTCARSSGSSRHTCCRSTLRRNPAPPRPAPAPPRGPTVHRPAALRGTNEATSSPLTRAARALQALLLVLDPDTFLVAPFSPFGFLCAGGARCAAAAHLPSPPPVLPDPRPSPPAPAHKALASRSTDCRDPCPSPPLPYLSPCRSPYCTPVAPRHHAFGDECGIVSSQLLVF